MPGEALQARYYQEIKTKVAMDRADRQRDR
jgi:hypothetical protein